MSINLLNKSDFHKDTQFKRVLNFNFSTDILFRCTSKKYAEDLKKGKFRFNQPKFWIEQGNKGNIGLGDSLEGVFLSTNINDKSPFIENLKNNINYEFFNKNLKTFFRRKEIKDLYCFCLYGLNSNSFKEVDVDRFGKTHYISRISKDYFYDFSDGMTKETYDINDENKKVVVFINNPHLFFKKIKDFFKTLDIDDNDIIISPVEYINRQQNSISFVPYPKELLLKDIYYSNQSEIRIIINSKSEKLISYMKDNKNIIDIGNIDNIVDIYDYYFDDMVLEKEGNILYFSLPYPKTENLENMTLRQLLAIFVQVSNDKLPYETSPQERKEIIDCIKNIINKKYNTTLSIENGQIVFYGLNKNLNEIIDT